MDNKKYPIVMQFFLIVCVIFDIYVFFITGWMFKIYAIVMFFVLLNSLTNSISNFRVGEYNDVYCILDMLEFSCFALMLLSIFYGNIALFWLLSFFVQFLYIPWNSIYIRFSSLSPYNIRKIRQYSILDAFSALISLVVFIIDITCDINQYYLLFGFASWIIVLGMWALDNFMLDSKLDLPGSKIMLYDVRIEAWRSVKSIKVNKKGIIEAIKLGDAVPYPDESTEFFMLPGLIDTHVHVDQDPYSNGYSSQKSLEDIIVENATESLESGVTTIVDMGGSQLNNYYAVNKIMHSNKTISRIETTGCFFSKQYGHYMSHGGFVIRNEKDASLYANYLAKLGIKYAKIMLGNYEIDIESLKAILRHGNTDDIRLNEILDEFFPNRPMLDDFSDDLIEKCLNKMNQIKTYSLEELRKIVCEFRNRNIDIFAHAYMEEDVLSAIDSGIKNIEHPGDYSEDLIKKMAQNGIIVTTTFVAAEDGTVLTAALPEISVACSIDLMQQWYSNVKTVIPKLYASGVKVALGTDSGFTGTPCCSLVREIISLVRELNISPQNVIKSATICAAEKINRHHGNRRIGELVPNAYADFVLYEANFLDNIDVLTQPSQVWLRGDKVFEKKYD